MAEEKKIARMWQHIDARRKKGRPFRFKTPEQLWKVACEYFAFVDDNPRSGYRKRSDKGTASEPTGRTIQTETRQRSYFITGLEAYTGISDWIAFKQDNKEREGFAEVIAAIEHVIHDEQLDGATLGDYNWNIVARLQGLAENVKQQTEEPLQFVADDQLDEQ